ncbi:CoA transferase subunit A [Metabacillus arenae]|nr:CoA transferase subunit A [Metabacillus arenae]
MVTDDYQKLKQVDDVLGRIDNQCSLMVGGFGGVGSPPTLIEAILEKGVKDLTVICNDAGFPTIGTGKLISAGRVSKLIASHIGSNPIAGKMMSEGKLEVEFSPQGTLAERIRAGGLGIGGILLDIGIDNEIVYKGKSIIHVDSKPYLLETPLTADVAIIYGKTADSYGNLIYDKSARNMNPLIAMAGHYTVAEVTDIVELGTLDEEAIITPGIFINSVVKSKGINWKWVWE